MYLQNSAGVKSFEIEIYARTSCRSTAEPLSSSFLCHRIG